MEGLNFTQEEIELAERVKEEKERLRRKLQGRPDYRVPLTKITKSEQTMKLVSIGYGMGFQVPRDVVNAMGLKKGTLVKVTVELFPSDVAKLMEEVNS